MATQRSLFIGVWCMLLHGALSPAQAAQRWSGSISAVTDYRYRGVTQSQGEPAIQGGVHAQSDNGWSTGAWGSTVDLNRAGGGGYELDLHATRAWSWGADWAATLGVTRYEYLDDHGALDYDHDEVSASLSFQQRLTATVAWSPNTRRYRRTAMRGRATAYELTFQQPLDARWSLFTGAGRYDLRELIGAGYWYWSAGLTFSWAALQIDAAHIGAERLSEYQATPNRWISALSVRF